MTSMIMYNYVALVSKAILKGPLGQPKQGPLGNHPRLAKLLGLTCI
jgi:hypothetical protein